MCRCMESHWFTQDVRKLLPSISYAFSEETCVLLRPKTRRTVLLSSYSCLVVSLLVGKFSQLLEKHITHTPPALFKLIYILYILPLYVKTCHTFREISMNIEYTAESSVSAILCCTNGLHLFHIQTCCL